MSDVAELGLKVDSAPVTAATAAIKELSGAARTATDDTERLSLANGKLGPTLRDVQGMADRVGVTFEEMSARVRAASTGTATFGTSGAASVARVGGALGEVVRLSQTGVAGFNSMGGAASRLLSSFNPMGGISVILQAITAATEVYFALTQSKSPTLEFSLSEQARLLGLVKDAYRDATNTAGKFYEQSKAIIELQTQQTISNLQDKIRDQSGQFIKSNVGMTSDTDIMGNSLGTGSLDVPKKFEAFRPQIEEFVAAVGQGAPAVERFRDAVASIGNANPALARIAAELLTGTQATSETVDKVNASMRTLRLLQGTATAADREGLGLSNPKPILATKDALDRATDSVQKYILQTNAQTASVGLSIGEQEKAKVIADLTAAALRDHKTNLGQYAAAWEDLGTKAGTAAQGLAQAKAQNDANFALQTVGLSDTEKQIAALNYQLHGNSWADFMNDGLSSTKRLTAAIDQMNQATNQFAQNLLSGLLRGDGLVKSLESAASSLVQTLASDTLKNFMKEGGSLFGNRDLNSAQGALAIGSAGVGAYQSGNALTGALGGALAGATFGPIGAALGGIAGAVGGLIGASANAEKELKAAQDKWASMAPDVGGFNTNGTTEKQQPANDNRDDRREKAA